MKKTLLRLLWRALILMLRYVFTLSSLSIMVVSRRKIGLDIFLPWNLRPKNPFIRVVLRLWMAILVFVWIRVFFLIEVMLVSTDPAPFDSNLSLWQLFIHYQVYFKMNAALFLHYLSFFAAASAFDHILASEIYYKKREKISLVSLGECEMTGPLEGKRIMGFVVDKFLIWGCLEPLFIIAVAIGVGYYFQLTVLPALLLIAGVSMFIQGQYARLEHRRTLDRIFTATIVGQSIQVINGSFREKPGRERDQDWEDEIGEASII